MQNRLETIGPESGERVMNFINTIPQSQHIRRNDFSHLGIHTPSSQQDGAHSGAVGGAAVPAAFVSNNEFEMIEREGAWMMSHAVWNCPYFNIAWDFFCEGGGGGRLRLALSS